MMLHSLLLTAMIGAPQTVFVVDAPPETVIAPAKSDGFYIQWSDGSYAYPGSPVLDRPQTQTVFIVGPWHNSREAIYATLQSPTRQQIETALEKARETWAAERKVSRSAVPFVWPLPSVGETVDHDLTRRGPWPKVLEFIEGMKRYKRASYTQEIAVTNNVDRITPVHRTQLENKDWMQSGGMLGIEGYRSDLYRNDIAANGVESWIDNISVKNSLGYFQDNRGWVARFSDGARFLDVLSNTKSGNVFEIRQRLKEEGKWRNAVIFTDEKERPAGYTGLTKSCVSCHSQAGTGGYAVGLVPGSDQTLSIGFKALEQP